MKTLGLLLLLAGSTSVAFAISVAAPEVDGGSAASVIALVAGSLTILRAKIRK